MDILTILSNDELREFAENLSYRTNFLGDKLFPSQKTDNIKATMRSLMSGASVPVMAQVHALDTEARIGDRPSIQEVEFEKLLIKEKINQTERLSYYKHDNASNSALKRYILDDAANMVSRVLTRAEVMKMEYLYSGKVTVDENNVRTTVDYKVPEKNRIPLSNWSSADADILGDIAKVQKAAKSKGYKVVRAITTSTVIGYMLNNKAIQAYWTNVNVPITESNMLAWINDNYKIQFVANDDVYKTKISATSVYPFFKENTISFITTMGTVGTGLFGVTPEELELTNGQTSERMKCAVTMWKSPDPVAVWTKATALYLPVPTDPNGLFIGTITA